jgi:hypothetical protein
MGKVIFWCWAISNFLESHSAAITAIATVFIATFTIALACSTKRLWKATKDTAKAARDNAEALPAIERAYLFVDVELRQEERFHAREVIIKIYNGGKTPATNMRAYADVIESDTCPPIDIKETKRLTLTEGDIISGDTTRIEPLAGLSSWTIPDIERLIKTETAFICYGRIDYKDVFERDHFTRFCWHHSLKMAMEEGMYLCRCDNKEANRRT